MNKQAISHLYRFTHVHPEMLKSLTALCMKHGIKYEIEDGFIYFDEIGHAIEIVEE